jgi:hypothetical protein
MSEFLSGDLSDDDVGGETVGQAMDTTEDRDTSAGGQHVSLEAYAERAEQEGGDKSVGVLHTAGSEGKGGISWYDASVGGGVMEGSGTQNVKPVLADGNESVEGGEGGVKLLFGGEGVEPRKIQVRKNRGARKPKGAQTQDNTGNGQGSVSVKGQKRGRGDEENGNTL